MLKLNTLLYRAAEKGKLDECKSLIKQGACANGHSDLIESPILAASRGSHVETVRLLIANGANVHDRTEGDGDTPLLFACRQGNAQMAKLLIENDANVSDKDFLGFSCFMWAAYGRRAVEIVKLLLEHGADPYERTKVSKSDFIYRNSDMVMILRWNRIYDLEISLN
jgi:ankyrin repeat protein